MTHSLIWNSNEPNFCGRSQSWKSFAPDRLPEPAVAVVILVVIVTVPAMQATVTRYLLAKMRASTERRAAERQPRRPARQRGRSPAGAAAHDRP